MQARKDSGVNQIGRITRGLKKSAIMDENEAQVQRRPVSRDATLTRKELLQFKRPTNNSKGLAERSINVARSFTGISEKSASNEPIKGKAVAKVVKTMMRFGGGNMLVSPDCADDIDSYMRFMEEDTALESNFLSGSAERGGVDGRMRQILVDWLIHVQRRFALLNETLSLAVFILDRALLEMEATINKNNLQLLGVSCIFVASKFEEIMVPNIQDFVYVAADVFNKKDVLRMEQSVLKAIGFRCSVSHSIQFLRRYRFYISYPKQVHNLAKFISEVALVVYSLSHYKPSTVAAAAIYLSSLVYKFHIPDSIYPEVMHMDEVQVAEVARKFVPSVLQLADLNAKLYALREKYKKEASLPLTADQVKRIQQFSSAGQPL